MPILFFLFKKESINSLTINTILKQLSLSAGSFLGLKQEDDIKEFKSDSTNIKDCLKIKFAVFL